MKRVSRCHVERSVVCFFFVDILSWVIYNPLPVYLRIYWFRYISLLVIPFISLFSTRLDDFIMMFSAGLVPLGSPFWVLPIIQHIELVSYLIRPVVILKYPFIKISVGIYRRALIGDLCLVWSHFGFLFVICTYEVFVALIYSSRDFKVFCVH